MRQTDKERILSTLLQFGGRASNARIRDHLGLSDPRYQEVRQELLDEKRIALARGRGGGIQIKGQSAPPSPRSPSDGRERDLYGPFVETLRRNAAEDDLRLLAADISAMRSRGMWRNPDVLTIEVRSHEFLRLNEVIVTTYEIKTADGWNLNSAYEAAAHRRFAHFSHLVIGPDDGGTDDVYEELATACGRLGVGLIRLHKHYTRFRQSILVEAEHSSPDLSAVNEFVGRMIDARSSLGKELEGLFSS